MIAVALPAIISGFGASIAGAGWLVTGYLIAMASLQPVTGKLGDRLGRRGLILGGLAYFGLVSLGATLAPSLAILLLFRVQQGIAAALVIPNGTALLREVVPAHRRAASFGLVGAVIGVSAAIGPPLGGFLVGSAGWRAIFLMNIFLLLPALLLGWRFIPKTAGRDSTHRFDIVGAVWLSALLISTAWLLTQSRKGDTSLLLPGVLAIVLFSVLFIVYELRRPEPVLQPRLFRHRSFSAACATNAFSNLAFYTTLLTLPILLAQREGWNEVRIGLVLMVLSATAVIFAPVGGRLADRYGRRRPVAAGLTLSATGLLILALAGADITIPLLLASLTVLGTGLGISSSGLQTAALEAVSPDEAGVAAGVYSTSRYLGSIVGASVLAALLSSSAPGDAGFDTVFAMVVVAAIIAVGASLGLHDRPQT